MRVPSGVTFVLCILYWFAAFAIDPTTNQKCICCCSICAASMSIDTKRQCSARIFRFDEVCRTSSCATPMHTVCAPSTHFHNYTSRNPNFQLCACASHDMSPYIILNYTTNNLLLINSSFHFPHPLRCASRRNLFKCSSLVVEFCVFGKGSTDLFDKRCALPK